MSFRKIMSEIRANEQSLDFSNRNQKNSKGIIGNSSISMTQSENKNIFKRCFENREKWLWWEPAQNSIPVEFCRDTSLHGLKYVGQPKRNLFERIFWFVAFSIGVMFSVILINGVWTKYNNSPVIITFQEAEISIFQIPFPTVTICNINNVLKSKAEQYMREADDEDPEIAFNGLQKLNLTNHVCTAATQSFSQKFGFHSEGSLVPQRYLEKAKSYEFRSDKEGSANSVKMFLRDAAQTCEKMILLCTWEGNKLENCSSKFQEIETDFGKCCSFNMIPLSILYVYQNDSRDKVATIEKWEKSELELDSLLLKPSDANYKNFDKNSRPRRVARNGKTFGLSILLDPQTTEYFCTAADSIGFQLAVHLPVEIPHIVDHGISVQPEHETFIRVTPDVTTAEPNIHNVEIAKRNCYFSEDFSLKYYKYYSSSNCLDECIANMTMSSCQCVRYYMPRDDSVELCGVEKYECAESTRENFSNGGLSGGGKCNMCLPSCTEILYGVQTSSAKLRDDVEIWLTENGEYNANDWSSRNLSLVHIYFSQDSNYPKLRKELYGITDLIANTGGLLGLCLGFSVMSLLEVIYFLTMRAWFQTRFKRRMVKNLGIRVKSLWKKVKGQIVEKSEERIENLQETNKKFSQFDYLTSWKDVRDKNGGDHNTQIIFKEISPYYSTRETKGKGFY